MDYEWFPAPPTLFQRIVATFCFALIVLSLVNWALDWQLVRPHARKAIAATGLLGFVLATRYLPMPRFDVR